MAVGFLDGHSGYRVLALALDDIEYHKLLLRARELRRVVEELGSLTAPAIRAGVDARLERQDEAHPLPPGQRQLVDEVVEILDCPGLSALQARGLAHAFRTE